MKKTAGKNQSVKEIQKQLDEKLKRASLWNGKDSELVEGDKIYGIVLNFETTEFERGKNQDSQEVRYCTIHTLEKNEEYTIALNTVLEKQFQKLDVQVNDTIAIEYLGKRPGKFGKDYSNYRTAKL